MAGPGGTNAHRSVSLPGTLTEGATHKAGIEYRTGAAVTPTRRQEEAEGAAEGGVGAEAHQHQLPGMVHIPKERHCVPRLGVKYDELLLPKL